MTDDTGGTAVWRATYAAFGAAVVDDFGGTVKGDFNIRFPGQYYDDETGLHYNRHRYYSPELGRYVSADPIGQLGILAPEGLAMAKLPPDREMPGRTNGLLLLTQRGNGFEPTEVSSQSRRAVELVGVGVNLFSYVLNSPVNVTDALGLWDKNAICSRACKRVAPQQCPYDPNSDEGRIWIETKGEPRCIAICIAKYSELGGAGAPGSEVSTGVGMVDAIREEINRIQENGGE